MLSNDVFFYILKFSHFFVVFCFACSVDASNEDEALGRLVNHNDFSPNCEMRQVVCEGKPHLCLFAVREIFPDDEITYRYGDSTDKLCFQVSFHTPSYSPANFPQSLGSKSH